MGPVVVVLLTSVRHRFNNTQPDIDCYTTAHSLHSIVLGSYSVVVVVVVDGSVVEEVAAVVVAVPVVVVLPPPDLCFLMQRLQVKPPHAIVTMT
jgi:hypothetical protein